MTAMVYRYILFTILLLTVTLLPAQTITRYEYWFGNDAGSRETVIEGSENINLTISIGGLSQGLQTLNFRVQNSDGVWGPIQRMLFYVPMEPEPSATVLGWEWWFDDDVQNHKSGSGSQTTVNMEENIGSLATGIHYLNFRVRNSLGNWSPVSRFLFVKPVNPEPSAQLSDVEYWIDDDYAHCIREKSSTTTYIFTKEISTLEVGLHVANLRVRNSGGDWSPVARYLFYVAAGSESTSSPYVGYYYSFNGKTAYNSIAESTDFVLQDKIFTIPDLQEIGNLETGTTFVVDATKDEVNLSRTQTIDFSLRSMQKDGSSDFSIRKSFDMSDELCRKATSITLGDTWLVCPEGFGDYRVLGFDNLLRQDIAFRSQKPCRLRLFDQQGDVLTAITLNSQQTINLTPGRYYAVISHPLDNSQNSDTRYEVNISAVNSSNNSADNLQEYLNSFADMNDLLTQTTYTRQFQNTEWQSLFVPFTLNYEDWCADFDIASIQQFNSYDDNRDGTADRQELVAVVMTSADSKIVPNQPYLIRAKKKGVFTFNVGASRMVEKEIITTTYNAQEAVFRITGNYGNLKGMKTAHQYRLAGGSLWIPNSDEDVLPPFRWYATIVSEASARPVTLRFTNCTTAVTYPATAVSNDELQVYDLSGRRWRVCKTTHLSELPKGIYLIDGKKYIVK